MLSDEQISGIKKRRENAAKLLMSDTSESMLISYAADAVYDVKNLLAEIERLRGELAARPVVLSRSKSDAIRIGAAESLIPKEKD